MRPRTAHFADELITASGIAELAEVSHPAVSNWLRRHADTFPPPWFHWTAGPHSKRGIRLWVRADVEAWLAAHENIAVSADERAARLRERAAVLLERADTLASRRDTV